MGAMKFKIGDMVVYKDEVYEVQTTRKNYVKNEVTYVLPGINEFIPESELSPVPAKKPIKKVEKEEINVQEVKQEIDSIMKDLEEEEKPRLTRKK